MTNHPDDLREAIVKSLEQADRGRLPKTVLEEILRMEHSEQSLLEALRELQDECVVQLVIDDREVDYSKEADETIWYVKLLDPKQRERLQSLSPVKRALLRIMQQTEGANIGMMPVKEARMLLQAQGFTEEETEWLSIEDWIDRVRADIGNGPTSCYRLVPDYERTEQYKREKEAQDLEWIRMDMERQASFDKLDDEAERRLRRRKKKK